MWGCETHDCVDCTMSVNPTCCCIFCAGLYDPLSPFAARISFAWERGGGGEGQFGLVGCNAMLKLTHLQPCRVMAPTVLDQLQVLQRHHHCEKFCLQMNSRMHLVSPSSTIALPS